jgi:hypothetical protein
MNKRLLFTLVLMANGCFAANEGGNEALENRAKEAAFWNTGVEPVTATKFIKSVLACVIEVPANRAAMQMIAKTPQQKIYADTSIMNDQPKASVVAKGKFFMGKVDGSDDILIKASPLVTSAFYKKCLQSDCFTRVCCELEWPEKDVCLVRVESLVPASAFQTILQGKMQFNVKGVSVQD